MRGFSLVIGLFVLASCKTSQDSLPDIGLDYFPLTVGSYAIYTVDETQINQSAEQKFVYELKLLVTDSVLNQEGGYTYIVTRQKRNSANLPWLTLDAWTARIANRQGRQLAFLSLNTDRPNHFQVGQTHQHLLHAIHFQGAHTAVDGR